MVVLRGSRGVKLIVPWTGSYVLDVLTQNDTHYFALTTGEVLVQVEKSRVSMIDNTDVVNYFWAPAARDYVMKIIETGVEFGVVDHVSYVGNMEHILNKCMD